MTNITAKCRKTLKAILADSSNFDAATMRVMPIGWVTAKYDANKTPGCNTTMRFIVAHYSDMIDASGNHKNGWVR